MLSFIKVYNREIHALEGPGYWVTWAEQFYTASNLSTEGIRRLYWQKDKGGTFRIVGMEWTPRDVGMKAAYQKGTLVAEAPAKIISDSEAPLAPRLDMPEQSAPAKDSPQDGLRASLVALAENLFSLNEPLVPRNSGPPVAPDEIIWGEGKRINEKNAGEAAQPARAIELPAAPKGPEKLVLTDALVQEIKDRELSWQNAYRQRDRNIESFYDTKDYNRLLPASGVPRGRSLSTTLQGIKRDFRQPWVDIISRPAKYETNGQIISSHAEMLIITPQGMRQGLAKFWWRKDKQGHFKLVASDFSPQSLGLEAEYLDKTSENIAKMIEKWRVAWEQGDVDAYMGFYAPNAVQQGRTGAANIRRQKANLWSRVKPAQVKLTGLRVSLEGNGARADMTQSYADAQGNADKGVKTLYLRYDGQNWLIHREDWSNLAHANGL